MRDHLPYCESDRILNVAYNILCGGGRLEDLNRLRNDVPYIAAPGAKMDRRSRVAGDFMWRVTGGVGIALMEGFFAVCPRLWRGRGRALLRPVAHLDVGGTLAPPPGKKTTGTQMSYNALYPDLPVSFIPEVGRFGARDAAPARRVSRRARPRVLQSCVRRRLKRSSAKSYCMSQLARCLPRSSTPAAITRPQRFRGDVLTYPDAEDDYAKGRRAGR